MNEEKTKKILIIGAGIAGLCAGVYAKKNGFDVEIVEMAASSGGLATSWKRGDYTFENCLHWLLGSKPSSPYYKLWSEVADMDNLRFYNSDEFGSLQFESGPSLSVKRNVDDFERDLLAVAPEDREMILRVARGVRRLDRCQLPLSSDGFLKDAANFIRMVPYLPELRYWSRMSCGELGEKFKNPLLRRFFGGQETSRLSAIALIFSLVWANRGDAGYAIGGSQALIRLIEQKFRGLGGHLRFHAKVDHILVSNGTACGVHLTDGTTLEADWVISAADGYSTLFNWLPKEFRDVGFEKIYRTLPVFPSYLQVSFGVKRNLSREPGFLTIAMGHAIDIDPKTSLDQISFRFFHFDPTFAPAGKTAVTCFLPTYNFSYWTKLKSQNPELYASEKERVVAAVTQVLERHLPNIRNDIEVTDISTPASVIHHTGNWRGSMEGFQLPPGSSFAPLRMKLPKLAGFRMVGQWVMPGGGLPSGLASARRCIQDICKEEGLRFVTTPMEQNRAIGVFHAG